MMKELCGIIWMIGAFYFYFTDNVTSALYCMSWVIVFTIMLYGGKKCE